MAAHLVLSFLVVIFFHHLPYTYFQFSCGYIDVSITFITNFFSFINMGYDLNTSTDLLNTYNISLSLIPHPLFIFSFVLKCAGSFIGEIP